ncbi:hypothetical protein H0V99_02460 [Candidatus Saccharibacteria bacterium]|nr:hypothetical protein [Candidatus Saccharibacteria bacterium]
MAAKTKNNLLDIKLMLLRASRLHFVYVAVYISAIIVFDSWNLLTHEAVMDRWTLAAVLLIVTTITWYCSRLDINNKNVYHFLFWLLIITDIVFAALNVYWQRGMASKAVMLFGVPILSAALLKSRSLLLTTATLSAAAYSLAAVRYFHKYYGQGLRVELYGEVGFYVALFFVFAGLLIIGFRDSKS